MGDFARVNDGLI
jgi:hypothetical protein